MNRKQPWTWVSSRRDWKAYCEQQRRLDANLRAVWFGHLHPYQPIKETSMAIPYSAQQTEDGLNFALARGWKPAPPTRVATIKAKDLKEGDDLLFGGQHRVRQVDRNAPAAYPDYRPVVFVNAYSDDQMIFDREALLDIVIPA